MVSTLVLQLGSSELSFPQDLLPVAKLQFCLWVLKGMESLPSWGHVEDLLGACPVIPMASPSGDFWRTWGSSGPEPNRNSPLVTRLLCQGHRALSFPAVHSLALLAHRKSLFGLALVITLCAEGKLFRHSIGHL